jgi:hypothetical protein
MTREQNDTAALLIDAPNEQDTEDHAALNTRNAERDTPAVVAIREAP